MLGLLREQVRDLAGVPAPIPQLPIWSWMHLGDSLMPSAVDDFKRSLLRTRSLPIIFVGSGFSRRYYGAPDWDGLLAHFAELAGHSLAYYRSKVIGNVSQDQAIIASMIEQDFVDIWWKSAQYEESRALFPKDGREKIVPIKIEMAKYIESLGMLDDEVLKAELAKLAKARIHAIITTNWDRLLESIFPNFQTFVGQDEVLFLETYGVGEIYKIHGSVTKPDSIVVTKDDYDNFSRRNSYLVAKLITMFIEHPVIFMGYSLSDPHIQELFREILNCLSSKHIRMLNERIYFLGRTSKERPESLGVSSFNIGGQNLQAYDLRTADFGSVYEVLSSLNEHYPVKLLRRLRRDIYRLAYETKPSELITVTDFDNDTDLDRVEVVIGIGKEKELAPIGYVGINRMNLVQLMLNSETALDGAKILNESVPHVLRSCSYAPIYYPMFLANKLDDQGRPTERLEECQKAQAIVDLNGNFRPYLSKSVALNKKKTFRDLLAEGPRYAAGYATICRYELEDVLALRQFLLENNEASGVLAQAFWSLACKYDHLVFGPGFTGDRAELHRALGIVQPATQDNAGRDLREGDQVTVTILVEGDGAPVVQPRTA